MKPEELIEGTWYSFDDPDYRKNTYAKFVKLSEIQHLLPDGHVDKINVEKPFKFEVGKWYSFKWKISGSIVICKVSSINNNSIEISWRKYLYDNSINTHDGYFLDAMLDIKELSIEEIQQYLPDNHPNKIKLMEIFVLPKLWCVKVDFNNQKVLSDWRTDGHVSTDRYILSENHPYCNNYSVKGYAMGHIPPNTTEITFEQFQKYVLNQPITQSKPIEKNWTKATNEELLEEAKRRYPIGTKIRCAKDNEQSIIKSIDAIDFDIHGYLYHKTHDQEYNQYLFAKNKWAEIISLPQEQSKSDITPEYVECIGLVEKNVRSWNTKFTIGKIYKFKCINPSGNWEIISNTGMSYSCDASQFKPSTREAYSSQNQPKSIEPINNSAPKYIRYTGDNVYYRIKNTIYEVLAWSEYNCQVICNIDCGNYNAGEKLCVDSLFGTDLYEHATKSEYENQGFCGNKPTPVPEIKEQSKIKQNIELISNDDKSLLFSPINSIKLINTNLIT